MSKPEEKKGNKKKLISIVLALVVAVGLARYFGLDQYISMDGIDQLRNWVTNFGVFAPIVYILIWVAACVFFLPGLPVAILGGIVFPTIPAIIYASVGSTVGATLAFLIGRYAARDMVEGWIEGNEQVKKIDDGVKKNGWRMLLLTRSVPVFPFNLQNYVYGLTDIGLPIYFIVTWLAMLPGTTAYILMASALADGESPMQILIYIGIAGILIVGLSLLPKFLGSDDMMEEAEAE